MKFSLILFSLLMLAPTTTLGAERVDPWDYWDIDVNEGNCTLTRNFSNERAQKDALWNRIEREDFDRFSISFFIPNDTRTHVGKTFVENEMYLYLQSELRPEVSDNQQRIDSVRINDIDLYRRPYSKTANFRIYMTDGQAAHDILRQLENAQTVTLSLGLSGGSTATLKVPSRPKERFAVWSKLLSACAQANVARKKAGSSPPISYRKLKMADKIIPQSSPRTAP